MKLTQFTAIVTAMSLTTFVAVAQTAPTPPGGGGAFARMPSIVLDNVQTTLEQRFDELDKNEDGVLETDELSSSRAGNRTRRQQEAGQAKGGQQDNRRGRGMRQNGLLMRMLHNSDANGDGQIEKSELSTAAERLTEMDTNNDGEVTLEELATSFRGRGRR